MQINGKKFDFNKIKRMTIGDQEDLESIGINFDDFTSGKITGSKSIDFLHFFMSRVDNEITREVVRNIPITESSELLTKMVQRLVPDQLTGEQKNG